MLHFNVLLPRNRNRSGWLRVEKDGRAIAEFPVLGRGSRGVGDTSFVQRGNTPTGTYRGTELVATSDWNQRSYGPWGAVRLKAASGNALLAEDAFGRRGLMIHGGEVGADGYWKGTLRPTWGCLRLFNEDMRKLKDVIGQEGQDDVRQVCRDVEIQVTVQEW